MTLLQRWRELDRKRKHAVGVPAGLRDLGGTSRPTNIRDEVERDGNAWVEAFCAEYGVELAELLVVAEAIHLDTSANLLALNRLGALTAFDTVAAGVSAGVVTGFFLGLDVGRNPSGSGAVG